MLLRCYRDGIDPRTPDGWFRTNHASWGRQNMCRLLADWTISPCFFVHGYTDIVVPRISEQLCLPAQCTQTMSLDTGCVVHWLGRKGEGPTLFT
jgi:hypothetical protein